ncbi:MAG: D-cysteine desulfhydrase [gamma proteobacterium symbiont of Ctena orbiculata]|uniref:D-cysteine desulfhydrase family protein n=1 Tax=Candidatus Thiodiazotropha taylori TaxID=2792791 RepID=A0A944MFL8_9GAMM|nr:D-cysteine desulfhydrase family protein [Candidatus Thiodiazotropha taylori]MBV2138960.1 D-cysteine desulfhydrase family protein [Candidatus Thiodiazotropha taylori]PVV10129.1 MAG: D-cysteine desulfhydrase [gamma proteobacterium symbiont of Ctena orbiculata]PVV15370.1 MAG: D-cysteine desulfhydrase [gamma proteobacterium symbiont of Ctena orbiculata]PVV26101.1 MAG: D-cysteine desulfhydrase [gamma proteobacterium symbiont of Ctena orbiculata]
MHNRCLPKVNLGFFPTPVVKLSKLSSVLGGPNILMKRDDMTGLALGGNKTRKLEYLLQDAIAKGCDTVITAGAVQSNHCRQTAAAAALLQLECHLILGGDPPKTANGNLLLDNLLGAQIHWSGTKRKGETIPEMLELLRARGKKPYVIPYGGSNELGAYAFVSALQELETQLDTTQLSHIVFASSSGGTHAGFTLGRALLQRAYTLVGINIDKGDTGEVPFAKFILNLADRTAGFIGSAVTFKSDDILLAADYVGDGYGVVGKLEKEALEITARYEGILLDPVYTGRAMGGLMDMIRTGKLTSEDRVLFWHTGGTPSLFAYAETLISGK